MKTRAERKAAARYRWDRLKVNFWMTPALMAAGAVMLAWMMYWLDDRIPDEALQNSRFVLAGGATELRTGLLDIAGTVLATAGMVFTLLTLPLSTVAAQYGSRLLRLFLGDRTAQFVLGMFVATFVYCIAAAFSIPAVETERASPHLTASLGVYLMLGTFATLILLVQHISTMLQAPNIAAAAGAELLSVVEAIEHVSEGDEEGKGEQGDLAAAHDGTANLDESTAYLLLVRETGYIQYIDPDTLLTPAREKDLIIRLVQKTGHFVRDGAVVALIWPQERVDAAAVKLMRRAFQIGNARTPAQDIIYAVNQLAEMAVRAMSPAINDPFTAMTCLDHLGNGLVRFVRQGERSGQFYDQDGKLRLVLEPVMVDELLDAAFSILRHASCDNASVLLHILTTIEQISQEAAVPAARAALMRHVQLIAAESTAGALIVEDRQRIQQLCEAILQSASPNADRQVAG